MNKPAPLNASAMRSRAIFERKVGITPTDFNKITKTVTIDDIVIEKVRSELEGRCSQHGWVIPGTLRTLSRSMCQNEAGRFTGAMVSWVQIEGEVYYPTDNMLISGEVLKKNKMGMFVTYENAVQVIVPRDLHIGDDEYDAVEVGQFVEIIIKKSRFQVTDPYILSVGEFQRVIERPAEAAVATVATVATDAPSTAPVAPAPRPPVDSGVGESKVAEGEEAAESEEEAPGGAAVADSDLVDDLAEVDATAAAASSRKTPGPALGSTIGDFF
jgi:DNA-directed RNA polymerase subunit E'/Rpb7